MTAAAPLTRRLSVVYLYVSDLHRSIAFYREVLGIPLEADAADPMWAEAVLEGGVRFALHLAPQGSEPQVPGTIRVNFEVDDIDAAAEHVGAAGVVVGEISREPYGSFFEFFDPDGYALECFAAAR
jgi:predicted enzyme related to lactoylglutathione lyase